MGKIFSVMAMVIMALSLKAKGAELSYQQDPIMGCFLTLKGEIKKGDASTIGLRLTQAQEVFSSSTPLTFSLGYNNDVRIKKRICLDSPGGSLSEAIKIAKLIYTNWGTAVGKGNICESACSVIFMAGSVSPEDDRGPIAQRILHPMGKLGFHAPSLQISEGEYSAESVSNAYNIALKGIGQIYDIAGFIKFPSSLIGEMIATPPGNMMYIETVGQAARWNITIAPSVSINRIDQLAVINACNNHYLLVSEMISLNGMYTRSHKIYYDNATPEIKQVNGEISAAMDGFGQEAASICRLSLPRFNIKGPPLPTNFLGWVSIGENSSGVELYPSLFFGPSTPIASLARRDDNQLEKIEITSLSKDVRTSQGRCYVFSGRDAIDNEPCNEITEYRYQNPIYILTSYIWPSGGKTVLEVTGSEWENGSKINGTKTKRQSVSKYEQNNKFYAVLRKQAEHDNIPDWSAGCWNNSTTGKTFCYQEYFQEFEKFR